MSDDGDRPPETSGRRWRGESFAGSPAASSFGDAAESYDRFRPGYPAAAVRWVLAPAGASPLRVLDLGAGTGKLTRTVLALGHSVVAVEPDARMRERLAATTAAAELLAGTGEAIPLPDAAVDAAVVGQAWHWLDHDLAGRELARVVRPGGTLGLLWNLRRADDPLQQALFAATGEGGDCFDGRHVELTVPGGRFGPQEHTVVDSTTSYLVDELVQLAATWSYVRLAEGRESTLRRVRAAAGRHADATGRVRYSQVTTAYRFVRQGPGRRLAARPQPVRSPDR